MIRERAVERASPETIAHPVPRSFAPGLLLAALVLC